MGPLALWRAAAHYRQGGLQRSPAVSSGLQASPAVSRRRAARRSRRCSVLFSAVQCAFSAVQCPSVFSVRSDALWCSSVSAFVAASLLFTILGNSGCSLTRACRRQLQHRGLSTGRGRREEWSTNADTCRQMQTNATYRTRLSLALAGVVVPVAVELSGACLLWPPTNSQRQPAVESPGTWSFLVLRGGHQWAPSMASEGPGCCAKWEQRQNRRQSITRQFEQLSRAFVDSQERTRVTRCVDKATDNGPLDVMMMIMMATYQGGREDQSCKWARGFRRWAGGWRLARRSRFPHNRRAVRLLPLYGLFRSAADADAYLNYVHMYLFTYRNYKYLRYVLYSCFLITFVREKLHRRWSMLVTWSKELD